MQMNRLIGWVPIALGVVGGVLHGAIFLLTGIHISGAGEFSIGWFSAGLFSAGVFSAGVFSAGIFSIGIFSIGVFSIGIFSLAFYVAIGIYAMGRIKESFVDHLGVQRKDEG